MLGPAMPAVTTTTREHHCPMEGGAGRTPRCGRRLGVRIIAPSGRGFAVLRVLRGWRVGFGRAGGAGRVCRAGGWFRLRVAAGRGPARAWAMSRRGAEARRGALVGVFRLPGRSGHGPFGASLLDDWEGRLQRDTARLADQLDERDVADRDGRGDAPAPVDESERGQGERSAGAGDDLLLIEAASVAAV